MNLPCFLRALRAFSRAVMPLLVLFAANSSSPAAQEPGTVRVSAPEQTSAGAPVPVTVELVAGETVERIALLYRTFGTSDFLRLDMDLRGNTATGLIPAAAVRPPVLEYYFVLTTRDGALVSHPFSRTADPLSLPPENLLRIAVRPEGERDAEVIFLSPEPGTRMEPEDVVVSVSLLRADTLVNIAATRILLDGTDVSADVVRSEDLLVYVPANAGRLPAPGPHTVTVLLYLQDGSLHRSSSVAFTVAGAGLGTAAPPPTADLRYAVSVQLESRLERLGGEETWYNRGGLTASGTAGDWTLRSNLFLTSDERSDRQPQNRFFIGASSPWVQLGYGDAYPSFTPLILDGKRVRGGHARLALGIFRLDATTGQTDRPIEGKLIQVIGADTLGLEQQRDPYAGYAQIDAATWGKYSYGSYERTLTAVRPSVGSDRDWRWGLSILKAKDDVESIQYGIRPQENLVLGTDFIVRAFHEAVELSGEAAFSAYNADISSGTFTDEYIDSVYSGETADNIRTVRDILGNYITVNDNLRPLSLDQLATAAYQVALGVNVFDNAFRFTYLYRGSDYTSFGQSYLRRDIQGFTLQDRLRLIDNRVFLSLSWERLQDNTVDIKAATTTFSTVDVALSYYPGPDLPSVTVGAGFLDNNNDLDAVLPDAVAETGTRFFLQSTSALDFGVRHTASVSISTGSRDDATARNADIDDFAAAIGVTSTFTPDLHTTVEYAYSSNTRPVFAGAPPEDFAYSTATLSARYGVVPREVILRAMLGPTFGDVERTLFGGGVEWFITPGMSLVFDGTYFARPGGPYDTVGSLRYRYDL